MKIEIKRIVTLFILAILLGPLPAFPQDEGSYFGDLGIVVVTGRRILRPGSFSFRGVDAITCDEMSFFPVHSPVEILRYLPGVNLQERGPNGVQADVSIRGSTFQQVLILLDGVKMNDPQTGHHNLDLPVNTMDLERIEVLHGQGSSVYGKDAFGGVVNFVTKNPYRAKGSFEAFAGQNGTWGGAFSVSKQFKNFGSRLSIGGKTSDGYRFDTDLRDLSLYNSSKLDFSSGSAGFSFAYAEKDFGANGFYGDWPSREHTRTAFTSLALNMEKRENFAVDWKVYLRQHGDKFVGDTTDPHSYVNNHVTYLYGNEVYLRTQWGRMGDLVLGLEIAKEEIRSNRLGNHSSVEQAMAIEYGAYLQRRLYLHPEMRIDHHSRWGWQFSPGMTIGYNLSPAVNLYCCSGRSFRPPDWTELYYWSPKNVGNPRLVIEQAWSYEVGADFSSGRFHSTSALFFREGRNLIDWVRRDVTSPWEAITVNKVDTYGMETRIEGGLGNLVFVGLAYTFLKTHSQELEQFLSKYTLNHPRHQLWMHFRLSLPWRINLSLVGIQKQFARPNTRPYLVLDGGLSKGLERGHIYFTVRNLLDISYEEIPGVPMPGRFLDCGLRWYLGKNFSGHAGDRDKMRGRS